MLMETDRTRALSRLLRGTLKHTRHSLQYVPEDGFDFSLEQSVEIRDVHIPQALEDAMSRQAQAERERQARIILGQAETEIAAKF